MQRMIILETTLWFSKHIDTTFAFHATDTGAPTPIANDRNVPVIGGQHDYLRVSAESW